MNRVELSWKDIEEPAWLDRAEDFALKALEAAGAEDWELSLLFCGDEFIRELNRGYRGLDEATDVLSFGMGETLSEEGGKIYLAGDIVISLPALGRNAGNFRVDPNEELKRLILHGILHLCGLDHEDNEPTRPMLRRQEELLSALAEEKIL